VLSFTKVHVRMFEHSFVVHQSDKEADIAAPLETVQMQHVTDVKYHADKKKGCRFDIVSATATGEDKVTAMLTNNESAAGRCNHVLLLFATTTLAVVVYLLVILPLH
jgi:hypothetical protein